MADEDSHFTNFGRYEEFQQLQQKFLSVDLFVNPTPDENRAERAILQKLTLIVRVAQLWMRNYYTNLRFS